MSGLIKTIFGGGQSAPAPVQTPIIPEPTVMPQPDDEASRRAKKRSLATQRARGGRTSTILSTEDKLG